MRFLQVKKFVLVFVFATETLSRSLPLLDLVNGTSKNEIGFMEILRVRILIIIVRSAFLLLLAALEGQVILLFLGQM